MSGQRLHIEGIEAIIKTVKVLDKYKESPIKCSKLRTPYFRKVVDELMQRWTGGRDLRLYEAKNIELFENLMFLIVPNQHLTHFYYMYNENSHIAWSFYYLYIDLVIHC